MDEDILAVVPRLAPRHVAALLHRLHGGERRRLHDAGLLRELALREAVALPQHAQEGPMAEGDLVRGEPRLQRADERTRRVLHEMGEAVVGDRLAPVAQDLPRRGLRMRALHAGVSRTAD